MKKIIFSTAVLLCMYNALAQDKVIWSQNGITFSYSLTTDGTIENPETGTKFTWYEVITQVSNATGKDMMVNSAQVYCKLNSERAGLNESDNRFCAERNNTGIFHGQLCRFNIICGNTTVKDIPKYLICPQGEMPAVEYYTIQAGELDQDAARGEEQPYTSPDDQGNPVIENEDHIANNSGSGQFRYQGTGYSGACTSKPLYDFCDGGSISVSINTDERDLWMYNVPQSDGGTFSISNGMGDNCELKFILPYFDDAGKYSYSSSESGTLTKTSSTSFTFTCKLASGETITGSGNYGNSEEISDPAETGQQQPGDAAPSDEEESDRFLIENKNRPGINTTSSGLQYQVLSQGTGPKPVPGDRVSVRFQGSLTNGDIIAVQDEPVVLPVNEVIAGWQEGLQLMPVGSRYKFFIPADLAYGDSGAGSIQPGATVIFEIELLEITE